MTALTADLAGPLSLLNREFQARFLQSIKAGVSGALTLRTAVTPHRVALNMICPREAKRASQRTINMTAIAADFENVFAGCPPFARALEALSAILAQHGRSRMVQWARTADDDATRICAVLFENTTLALALLRDLDRAHRSGSPKRVARVRRRLDRVLDMIETRERIE